MASTPTRTAFITVASSGIGVALAHEHIDRGVQSAVVPAFPWVLVKWLANAIPTSLLASQR